MQNTERVLLVSMPFASSRRPSLGLGLLQAKLQEAHIPSYVWYPFLPFIPQIGTHQYEEIADGKYPSYYMIGDWIFSPWLMSDPQGEYCDNEKDTPYFNYLQRDKFWLDVRILTRITDQDIEAIGRMRQIIPTFFESILREFDWNTVQFVGFTSVFQQHVASIAFARILKERYPHITTVIGGANVEGKMGLGVLQSFPWIDGVVSGEGDNVIVPLVQAVLDKTDYSCIPGVRARRSITVANQLAVKMDDLSYPVFDDFFDQREAANIQDITSPAIMVETSRGCWWGEHSHCTFCGLNGMTMAFRSKNPQRALDEILSLWDRYSNRADNIIAVDNILDYRYIHTVLPQLAEKTKGIRLFYETKANLKKEQIALFAQANIQHVQPGIESLSSHVLKIMRKGVSALQNVQMLKWCLEYGVVAYWNLLWGFPEEHPDDYCEANTWASRLFHIRPPVAISPIRLDRFSPLFDSSDEFGLTNIKPVPAYDHIFAALSPLERFNLAYFFDFEYQNQPGSGYVTDLTATVGQWKQAHSTAALFYFLVDNKCMLVDTRTEPRIWLLDREYLALFDAIDVAAVKSDLASQLQVDSDILDAMVNILDEHQWILQEGNRVLGLPIRLGRYQPSGGAQQALSTLIDRETGRATVSGQIKVPIAVF